MEAAGPGEVQQCEGRETGQFTHPGFESAQAARFIFHSENLARTGARVTCLSSLVATCVSTQQHAACSLWLVLSVLHVASSYLSSHPHAHLRGSHVGSRWHLLTICLSGGMLKIKNLRAAQLNSRTGGPFRKGPLRSDVGDRRCAFSLRACFGFIQLRCRLLPPRPIETPQAPESRTASFSCRSSTISSSHVWPTGCSLFGQLGCVGCLFCWDGSGEAVSTSLFLYIRGRGGGGRPRGGCGRVPCSCGARGGPDGGGSGPRGGALDVAAWGRGCLGFRGGAAGPGAALGDAGACLARAAAPPTSPYCPRVVTVCRVSHSSAMVFILAPSYKSQ